MLKKLLLSRIFSQEGKFFLFSKSTTKFSFILIIILVVFLFLAAAPVLAQPDVGIEYGVGTGLTTRDIRSVVALVINAALGLLGIVAVGIILYGGFVWMTSGGDPEKITKAKKILINGTIGLAIILSSYAIAQFIIFMLMGGRPEPPSGGSVPTYGEGGGALGSGIIESHYPGRDQSGVPRNTSIVVTFKQKMQVDTIISGTDINTSNVIIKTTRCASGSDAGNYCRDSSDCSNNDCADDVVTAVTAEHIDQKTFVFKPANFLGSNSESFWYSVELTSGLIKDNGKNAFALNGNYLWKFQVSTEVDLTPPQIKNVVPKPNDDPAAGVPRNMVVQINFNEAINPLTIKGIVDVEGGKAGDLLAGSYDKIYLMNDGPTSGSISNISFSGNAVTVSTVGALPEVGDTITIINSDSNPSIDGVWTISGTDSGAGTFEITTVVNLTAGGSAGSWQEKSHLAGEFMFSNGYKTVEFITNDLCGKNTCGGDVFCLPENEEIMVFAQAAQLADPAEPTAIAPYTGIVDMADNSLDGNKDKQAIGPVRQSLTEPSIYITDAGGRVVLDPLNNLGDDGLWIFQTNDQIKLEPPEVYSIFPTSQAADQPVWGDYSATFDSQMMSSTLKPGSGYGNAFCACTNNTQCPGGSCDTTRGYCLDSVGDKYICDDTNTCSGGQPCIEYISLLQPDAATLVAAGYPGGGWAFWVESTGVDLSGTDATKAIIRHGILGENLDFGILIGSEVKDLFQNCYQPCADKDYCKKQAAGVSGQYNVVTGEWEPDDSSYPTCDRD